MQLRTYLPVRGPAKETTGLAHVRDAVGKDNYTVDIDNQGADNYAYDAIGNLKKDVAEGISNIDWTVYGKIKGIAKTGTTIQYGYDPSGNRIVKQVASGDTTRQTYYVRDAQGNTMAVYSRLNNEPIKWEEQHLYGSSRLGLWRWDTLTPAQPPLVASANFLQDSVLLGSTQYELINHLGNVLATISDKKIGVDSSGVIKYFEAEVLSQNDYYPFGLSMPERKYSLARLYRYGFNGKENDGETGRLDYGMRIYNPALGKFLSVDPLANKFPYYTPYQYAGNKPIWCIDLDGLEDLPSTSLNKYGEKQVFELTSITYIGEGWPQESKQKVIPQYAQPATKGLTDVQVYQLAFARFTEPGKHLIKSNQYIDERLMKADQQVDYFFSHQVPAYSKSTVATRIIHTVVAFGLAQGDESTVAQIQKSDDFLYRNNLGALIVGGAPIGEGLNVRKALAAFSKIEARSLKLLANGYKSNWAIGNLQEAITKFVGRDATFELAESGKIIWKSEGSSMQVIQDPLNKYYRVLDTRLRGKRTYTDLDGIVPNNKIINGKTTGNTQAEYNQLTHFNYE